MPFKPQALLPGAAAGALSTKRNSLPPLRSVPSVSGGGQTPTGPNTLPAAAGALPAAGGLADIRQATFHAADAVGIPGGPGRSRVGSTCSISAALHTEAAAAEALPGPPGQYGAALAPLTPADSSRLQRQHSSTLRHSIGGTAGPSSAAAAAGQAMQQLESVCRAQVEVHRCVLCWCPQQHAVLTQPKS